MEHCEDDESASLGDPMKGRWLFWRMNFVHATVATQQGTRVRSHSSPRGECFVAFVMFCVVIWFVA